MLPTNGTFVCEVILPERSPIRGITGAPAMNKATAKRSAAFDTCVLLRKQKLLDEHFNSVYHKRLPAMRNAKLAITCKKTNEYDMIQKPSLWADGRGTMPDLLYATVITFKPIEPLARQPANMVLIARTKLPDIPRLTIYLEEGDVETVVQLASVENACTFSSEDLSAATAFTLRIFQDVFNKTYTCEPENMSYFSPSAIPFQPPSLSLYHMPLEIRMISVSFDWSSTELSSQLNVELYRCLFCLFEAICGDVVRFSRFVSALSSYLEIGMSWFSLLLSFIFSDIRLVNRPISG